MSYCIYQTEGFVIDRRFYGEADSLVYIFTKEFGLILAVAKSLREMRSKLRPLLSSNQQLDLSLVRGREFWRIVSVEAKDGGQMILSPEEQLLRRRIFFLLRRLLAGEGKDIKLYEDIVQAFDSWRIDHEKLELIDLEWLMIIRILRQLGYLPTCDQLKVFLGPLPLTDEIMLTLKGFRSLAINVINQTFEDSDL